MKDASVSDSEQSPEGLVGPELSKVEGRGSWLDLSLDLRSLALSRILLSCLILFDLYDRSRFLFEHYGSEGLIRSSLVRVWSFHLGSQSYLLVLFSVHALLTVCLGLGWKTKWVTPLSWLFLLSLHNRNPFVLYGADGVFILMLAWAIFLPWGRVWSLDSRYLGEPESFQVSFRNGGFWFAQFTLIYFVTALRKSGPEWWDGTALYHAVTSFQYFEATGQRLSDFIVAHPWLGQALTYLTLGWEYLIGFLIYTRWRVPAVLSVLFFHTGVFFCLDVGLFPPVSSIFALSFLPSSFWRRKRGQTKSRPPFRKLSLLAWTFFLISGFFGLMGVFAPRFLTPQDSVYKVLECLGLRQTWNMFAPRPPMTHGWYSAKVILADGSEREFLTAEEKEYSSLQPKEPLSDYSMRWGNFYFVTYVRRRSRLRPVLADFLKRRWSATHPDKPLKKIELIYYVGDIVPYQRQPFDPKILYEQTE